MDSVGNHGLFPYSEEESEKAAIGWFLSVLEEVSGKQFKMYTFLLHC